MKNWEERNSFFLENYPLFYGICNKCARIVGYKFPNVPRADLIGYAFEGILIALDKVDLENDKWIRFVRKYAIGRAVSGALDMCGAQRRRVKGGDEYISNVVAPQSDQLKDIIESEQIDKGRDADTLLDEFHSFDETDWFLNAIEGSVEHAILIRLILGRSFMDISDKHQLCLKTIKKFMEQLKMVFQEASEHKPISHFLTPIEKSAKYASLVVDDNLKAEYESAYKLFLQRNESNDEEYNSIVNEIEAEFDDNPDEDSDDMSNEETNDVCNETCDKIGDYE